ncbi:hypothetical protein [Burkholderia cenocepacia]|uniref:hypothetical protein n=1 Tax=Burkholderia cenocepacia TaxID=95486 RepID=UPI00158ECE97|nr:hypothetical protein [Burkholderia cenocepacia]
MPIENIVAAAELSATTDPVGNCTGTSLRAARDATPFAEDQYHLVRRQRSRAFGRECIERIVSAPQRMRVVTD